MNNRKSILFFLLGVLALAAVHVALTYCGGMDTRIVRRNTLVDPNRSVMSVSVVRRGEPETRLVRSERWRLVEPFPGSVDEQVVMRMLDGLTLTPVADVISDAELLRIGRTRADFQLDDPPLVLTLCGSEGEPERISFGACTPSSNEVYAAVSGVDAVFVLPSRILEAVSVPADRMRRRSLFLVGPESVSGFDVKRGTGSMLGFVRDGERWKLGDAQASAAKVKAFLSGVLTAEAVGFVWPVGATNEAQSASASLLAVYELDPESAVTVTMKCVDGKDRQVSFGGEAGENLVFALVQNGGAIVTVDAKLKELAQQEAVLFTDSRIFPYEAETVLSFTIADGDAGYVVARGEDGGWRLDAPVAAAADAETVNAILDKLLALSAADIRSEGLRVSLSTNAEPVVVSAGSALGRMRLEDLRSKDILKIDPVRVKRLVRSRSGDPKPSVVVYGRERRAWNVEAGGRPGTVNERGVLSVLSVLNPLRAGRIERLKVAPEDLARYGLEKPFLTVAVDQDREDAVRRNILIGAETEGGRFATVGSSDAVFVLPDEVVRKLGSALVDSDGDSE